MKAQCNSRCSGENWLCKYYSNCFNEYILLPRLDSLTYLQKRLKGQKIKIYS